jgi:hypothetical protein
MMFFFLLLLGFQTEDVLCTTHQFSNFYKISSSSHKPKQKYKWMTVPKIRLCQNTEVSLSRVQRAVNYWERLGYEFGDIYLDRLSYCMHPKDNEIAIVLPSQGIIDGKMAATRVYTSKFTGEILKARIYVLPKTGMRERVLEHEIGHALGWQHYNYRNHIMHPNWWQGGHSSYGLNKR